MTSDTDLIRVDVRRTQNYNYPDGKHPWVIYLVLNDERRWCGSHSYASRILLHNAIPVSGDFIRGTLFGILRLEKPKEPDWLTPYELAADDPLWDQHIWGSDAGEREWVSAWITVGFRSIKEQEYVFQVNRPSPYVPYAIKAEFALLEYRGISLLGYKID